MLLFITAFILGILSMFGLGRPDAENYKAPVLGVFVSGALLAVVAIVMVGTIANPAQPQANVKISTKPIVDEELRFRLNYPGEGWEMATKETVQKANKYASAGARHSSGIFGMIIVSLYEQDVSGNEGKIGRSILDNHFNNVKKTKAEINKESSGAEDFKGMKSYRYRIVTKLQGKEQRFQAIIFWRGGLQYQIVTLGDAGKTAEDGSSFSPFVDAFELLPEKTEKDGGKKIVVQRRGRAGETLLSTG